MDPVTEKRLRELAAERNAAQRTFEQVSGELGRLVASRPAPMAEVAEVLGVSRQAAYKLAEKWGRR